MTNRVIAAALMSALAATPVLALQAYPPGPGAPPIPPAGRMRGPGAGDGGLRAGGGARMLRMADANGDGIVTRAEYVAAIDARFDRMDANHDGLLSPDEMPMRGGGMPGGAGARAGASGTPPASPMPPRPPVTRDQYRAGAMRRFDRLDANHDGSIDQVEMAAAATMAPARGGAMSAASPPPGDQ